MLSTPVWADGEYRTFTGKEGRETKAKIVKVDTRSGQVTVDPEGGRRNITVPYDIFSLADQAYIREWAAAQDFFMNSRFRISVDEDKEKTGDNTSAVTYNIVLDNRSDLSIPNVRVEYCMCVNTSGFNGKPDTTRTIDGSLDFGRMAPGEKKTLKTSPGELKTTEMSYQYEDTYDNGYTSVTTWRTAQKKATEDKLAGIMLRVYGPAVEGKQIIREYNDPSGVDRKFQWPKKARP